MLPYGRGPRVYRLPVAQEQLIFQTECEILTEWARQNEQEENIQSLGWWSAAWRCDWPVQQAGVTSWTCKDNKAHVYAATYIPKPLKYLLFSYIQHQKRFRFKKMRS